METDILQGKDKLQPEHIRAINYLDQKLDSLVPTDVHSMATDIWNTGCIKMFLEPPVASLIPSESDWRWNQTKARKEAQLVNRNAKIFIHKLIPRKKDKTVTTNVPKLKLWSFEIQFGETSKYVLWCERGNINLENPIVTLPPATIDPGGTVEGDQNSSHTEIDIDQYQFLKDFMPKHVADTFWPDIKHEKP